MAEEYSPAVNLLAQQMAGRAEVRKSFKKEFDKLTDAHQFAFSALASAVMRHLGKEIASPSPEVEGRIALIAQFLTGIEVCETAISEGLYSQAAALLKQELETVAALEEYRDGKRKDGSTPRIGQGKTRGYGRAYGLLNEISHVSRHGTAKGLVSGQIGDLVGAHIVPTFIPDLASFLYGQHVAYIGMVVHEADLLFSEVYGAGLVGEETANAGMAQMILLMEKLVEVPADALGPESDWVRSLQASDVTEGKSDAP